MGWNVAGGFSRRVGDTVPFVSPRNPLHVPQVRVKERRGPDMDNLCEGLLLRADMYFIECDVSTPHAQQKDLLKELSL